MTNFLVYAFCTVGIFSCFLMNSILMEGRLKKKYNGERFNFWNGMVMIQSSMMLISSLIIKILKKEKFSKDLLNKNLIKAGFFQTVAIGSTIQLALKLSYLVQILFRSSKFVSVLFGSLIFKSHGSENIDRSDIIMAGILTVGVVIFNLGNSSHRSVLTEISGFLFGFVSLICDCGVSHFQNNLKKLTKLTFLDLTFGMNFYLFLFSFLYGILTGNIVTIFKFLLTHPMCLIDMLVGYTILCCGLYFIFYHLFRFGPVSVAYISTFRKIISILMSIWIYDHSINTAHGIGLAVVMFVISFDTIKHFRKLKLKNKQKIKKD